MLKGLSRGMCLYCQSGFCRLFRPGGFTLVELLISLSVLAILIAMVFPAVSRMSERASQTQCAGNLRQIMAAIHLYTSDNSGYLPIASRQTGETTAQNTRWSRDLDEYLPQSRRGHLNHIWENEVFVCSAAINPAYGKGGPKYVRMSYSATQALYGNEGSDRFSARNILTIPDPSRTMLIYESKLGTTFPHQTNYYNSWAQISSDFDRGPENMTWLDFRHNNRMNIAMLDGSIQTVDPSFVTRLNFETWQGRRGMN